MKKWLISATAALLMALSPSGAQAVTLITDHDMGTVAVNDSGYISTTTLAASGGGYKYDFVKGVLPTQSSITFTYFLLDAPVSGYAQGGTYDIGGSTYTSMANTNGSSFALTPGLTTEASWLSPTSGIPGTWAARVVVTNLSAVAAAFDSYFFRPAASGLPLDDTHAIYGVAYEVAAVPLPAALPLFGLGLAGLAGYSRRKKKAA